MLDIDDHHAPMVAMIAVCRVGMRTSERGHKVKTDLAKVLGVSGRLRGIRDT